MAYWNYDRNYHFEKFKSKFLDQQLIPITPSQAWQDLFVLTMLDGKKKRKLCRNWSKSSMSRK